MKVFELLEDDPQLIGYRSRVASLLQRLRGATPPISALIARELHRFGHLRYPGGLGSWAAENEKKPFEFITVLRDWLEISPADRPGIDRDMHDSHPELLRNPGKVRRQSLTPAAALSHAAGFAG